MTMFLLGVVVGAFAGATLGVMALALARMVADTVDDDGDAAPGA